MIVQAIDAGTDVAAADHAPDPMGLPMTPLRLLDFVGPAVLHHVDETMHRAYPERFARSPWMDAVVGAGLTHVLPTEQAPGTGADGYLAADAARLLERTRAEHPADAPVPAEELLVRVQDALAEEIGAMLAEGVRRRARGRGPVHGPRRQLPLPPGRDHPVPRPHGRLRARPRPPLPPGVTLSPTSHQPTERRTQP